MEIIAVCATIGLLIGFALIGVGVIIGGMDKRKLNGTNNDDDCISIGDGDRVSDNGFDKQMDAEEVINGLQYLRMSLSPKEKEYLDYACECVEKIERLNKYIDGE